MNSVRTALEEFEVALNSATRDDWNNYRNHRNHVTSVILSAATKCGPRVLVLGAGNCNDLNLSRLLAAGLSVHLADIDVESCELGLTRQGVPHDRISDIYSIDFTGLGTLDADTDQTTSESIRKALSTPCISNAIAARFDVVICTCVFSQMVAGLSRYLTQEDKLSEFVATLRHQFVSEMHNLTDKKGCLIWVSDLVSSDSCPELQRTAVQNLHPLLNLCLESGNFFSGTHPQSVLTDIESVTGCLPHMHPPWSWNVGPRTYGVYALSTLPSENGE